ncbi:MAG: Lsr2 family protein [Propionibacteriaceae bacterium]|nr:Lsr2 family protein [Propionibacteriaceae bacterium]
MAREVQVFLKDDIDGTVADRNVTFALDGVEYEIDLNEGNIAKLVNILEPWTTAARRVRGSKSRSRRRVNDGPSTNDVRVWARSQGHEVSDRGRIPAAIMAAYEAAH